MRETVSSCKLVMLFAILQILGCDTLAVLQFSPGRPRIDLSFALLGGVKVVKLGSQPIVIHDERLEHRTVDFPRRIETNEGASFAHFQILMLQRFLVVAFDIACDEGRFIEIPHETIGLEALLHGRRAKLFKVTISPPTNLVVSRADGEACLYGSHDVAAHPALRGFDGNRNYEDLLYFMPEGVVESELQGFDSTILESGKSATLFLYFLHETFDDIENAVVTVRYKAGRAASEKESFALQLELYRNPDRPMGRNDF